MLTPDPGFSISLSFEHLMKGVEDKICESRLIGLIHLV